MRIRSATRRAAHRSDGPATEATVTHRLKRLLHVLDGGGVTSLAPPRLATGLGGLGWEVVFPLVRKHLGDSPVPVYVYTRYEKGVAATEPH